MLHALFMQFASTFTTEQLQQVMASLQPRHLARMADFLTDGQQVLLQDMLEAARSMPGNNNNG